MYFVISAWIGRAPVLDISDCIQRAVIKKSGKRLAERVGYGSDSWPELEGAVRRFLGPGDDRKHDDAGAKSGAKKSNRQRNEQGRQPAIRPSSRPARMGGSNLEEDAQGSLVRTGWRQLCTDSSM